MLHPRGERIGIVETGDSGEWTGKVLWHRHLPGGYLAKAYASVYGGTFLDKPFWQREGIP